MPGVTLDPEDTWLRPGAHLAGTSVKAAPRSAAWRWAGYPMPTGTSWEETGSKPSWVKGTWLGKRKTWRDKRERSEWEGSFSVLYWDQEDQDIWKELRKQSFQGIPNTYYRPYFNSVCLKPIGGNRYGCILKGWWNWVRHRLYNMLMIM